MPLKSKTVEARSICSGDEILIDPLRDETVVVADVERSQFSTLSVFQFVYRGQLASASCANDGLIHKVVGR